MKRIRINIILLILSIFLFACGKGKKDNFLEGPLTIESKEGVYLLYNKDKLATGVLKGRDMIIGLNYDMYYFEGRPTGKIDYFNEDKKAIEVDMKFDYENNIASGNVKIFDYNENNVAKVGMQYLNIISKPENFIDIDNARPTLKWYLENPVNIFEQVDILNGEAKISTIRDDKYFFYDEEGNSYEIPMLKGETGSIDDILIYAEEDDKILIDERDESITYINTDKSVSKIKIGAVFGNGMFKVIDDNNNSFVIEYALGIPTGNFEIDSSLENGGFKIYGNGKYRMAEDIWQGDINIYTEDENFVELKNMKILGENLYREKNIIDFSWISIFPTRERAVDLENIKNIIEADVYFNEEIVGKIINGVYRTLN